MHELSLCEGILRIIEKQAVQEKFTRVERVRVVLGSLSGVSEEALAFCFPSVVKNTVADQAELVFVRTEDNAFRVMDLDVV
jgi:hydrogenase nickel incorporation protein HypA/HybF